MSSNFHRYYKVIDGRLRTCSLCRKSEPIIEEYTDSGGDLFCIECARQQLDFSTGVSDALLALLDDERSYASSLADNIAELFSGRGGGADEAPWATPDADGEVVEAPPAGYMEIAPDRYGLRWIPGGGLNYGKCDFCPTDGAELLGVHVSAQNESHIEQMACRSCAVRDVEDANALAIVIIEAEALLAIKHAKARAEELQDSLGFIPLAIPHGRHAA